MDNSKKIGVQFTFYNNNTEVNEQLDFPATQEDLRQMLERAGVSNTPHGRMTVLFDTAGLSLPHGTLMDLEFDEVSVNTLNYLSAKLLELDDDDLDKLATVIESGRHFAEKGCGDGEISDYLNIIDNLDSFTYHLGMGEQGYGEYLLAGPDSRIADLIRELRNNYRGEGEELADLVDCLRESADAEQFGKSMAYNNDGDFLDNGYLIEGGGFSEAVYGIEDIPAEYRIWEQPDTFIKVANVDLRGLLMEMHALGGNYTQDAAANLQTLVGGDCFIVVNADKLTVFPAVDVFHMDSPHCTGFVDACSGHARVFFAAEGEGDGSNGLRGSIHEIVTDALMMDVHNLEFDAVNIDAEFKDGTNRVFTPTEWSSLSEAERGQVAGMVNRYSPAEEGQLAVFFDKLREDAANNGRAVTQEDFLAELNVPFMAKAQNAQQSMLRIAREAARDMVARSDAEVYRLLPEGALKLSPMDVVKSNGLWFPEHREFAIKLGGLAGLRKWANRAADEIERQAERGLHHKSRETEH